VIALIAAGAVSSTAAGTGTQFDAHEGAKAGRLRITHSLYCVLGRRRVIQRGRERELNRCYGAPAEARDKACGVRSRGEHE
jgi:hypothetical protein